MLTVPDMGTSRPYEVQIMDAYNQNIMVIGAPFLLHVTAMDPILLNAVTLNSTAGDTRGLPP